MFFIEIKFWILIFIFHPSSFQSGPNDIQFFDKEFTEAEPALTPVDDSIINDLNHDLFDGFDYTNPSLTD